MIAHHHHTFSCPHCKAELRLRAGAELTSGECPSCGGWLHAPRKMAMNTPTSHLQTDSDARANPAMIAAPDRFPDGNSHREANFGEFAAHRQAPESAINERVLPPRRNGAPPRLLGDHPSQIAQTSVPITGSRPAHHHGSRKKEIHSARRWANAKMIVMSVVVFGLIGGTILWTRSTTAPVDEEVVGSGRPAAEETQVKAEEEKRQIVRNDEGSTAQGTKLK